MRSQTRRGRPRAHHTPRLPSMRIALVFRQGKWHRIIMVDGISVTEALDTAKRRVMNDSGFSWRAWSEGHAVSIAAYWVPEGMPSFDSMAEPDTVFVPGKHAPIRRITMRVSGA